MNRSTPVNASPEKPGSPKHATIDLNSSTIKGEDHMLLHDANVSPDGLCIRPVSAEDDRPDTGAACDPDGING